MRKKRDVVFLWVMSLLLLSLFGCSVVSVDETPTGDNKVVIYTSAEEYRIEYLRGRLDEQFPDYDISVEYIATGPLAARLQAEGEATVADIVYDIEYGYATALKENFADLSGYDMSIFLPDILDADHKFMPELRNGGCIAVNTQLLSDRNLPVPQSYADLLKPEYKGLISMPNPKSSGTGYMFLRMLVNAWGEEAAFSYFDQLAPNILSFTSSGSGPVNALIMGEAAIGFAMISQTVTENNKGAGLELLFFEEGAPYSLYAMALIRGREEDKAVKEVFDFFYTTLIREDKAKFFPEAIFREQDFTVENYPQDIPYGDMSGDTQEEKTRLLEQWKY